MRVCQSTAVTMLGIAVFLTSCATTPPPQAPPAPVDTTAVEARLQGLQDRGVAEELPELHHQVVKLIGAVNDRMDLAQAETALDELELAFEEVVVAKADIAVNAFMELKSKIRQMDRTVGSGSGCETAKSSLAALKQKETDIRNLVFNAEQDVRSANLALHECERADVDIAQVLAEAAACGTVLVTADNADQMLAAAKRMVDRESYGGAVRLYGAIISGAKGTGAAEQATARLDNFGEDFQKRLENQVRTSVEACDTERAFSNYTLLSETLEGLSSIGARTFVDTGISRRLPELQRSVGGMGKRCGIAELKPDEVVVDPISEAKIRATDLLEQGDIEGARQAAEEIPDDEMKLRMLAQIDAEETLMRAEQALVEDRVDEAIVLAQRAWDGGASSERSTEVLGEARTVRAERALADGRAGEAVTDVQAALAVAPKSRHVRNVAAAVYAELGRSAGASGNHDEALRLYHESTRIRDNADLRLEMSRLYAGQRGRGDEAQAQLKRAIELGAQVDVGTYLQVMVVAPMLAGDTEAAWGNLDKIAGEATGGEADDLIVHALRLPLSTGMGRLVGALAGEGGRFRRGDGVVVFAGSRIQGLDETMMSAALRVESGAETGVSDDLRYMAVREPGGGVVIYDAQAGKVAQKVAASVSGAGLGALAHSEVAMALAPFVVVPIEEALASNASPAEKNAAIESGLRDLVGAGLSYALFADSRGKVRLAQGTLDQGYAPGLRPGTLSGSRIRRVDADGSTYQEVVVPVRIRGAVQAMLLLGVPVLSGDVSED